MLKPRRFKALKIYFYICVKVGYPSYEYNSMMHIELKLYTLVSFGVVGSFVIADGFILTDQYLIGLVKAVK